MPYLVEHLDCTCYDQAPQVCDAPEDVALYLWGREVVHHLVWAGECPYQFHETNIRIIASFLETCPPAAVRDLLPCAFWAGSQVLVKIGWVDDRETQQLLREVSYMTWLHHRSETQTRETGAARCATHA